MLNEGVYLQSARLTLVPYLPHHVAQYHAWMGDAELLACTESEPLTLAEEYANQAAWLQATDKLTFILLARNDTHDHDDANNDDDDDDDDKHDRATATPSPPLTTDACRCSASPPSPCASSPSLPRPWAATLASRFVPHAVLDLCTGDVVDDADATWRRWWWSSHSSNGSSSSGHDDTAVMIGDCNLFLLHDGSDSEADGDDDDDNKNDDDNNGEHATADAASPRVFEVEVMIAARTHRRRGLAEEAVRLLMQYAIAVLGATRFVAKILASNDASVRLFEQRLHFRLLRRVPVFGEVHYTRALATHAQRRRWCDECVQHRDRQHTRDASKHRNDAASRRHHHTTTPRRVVYVCGPYSHLDTSASNA